MKSQTRAEITRYDFNVISMNSRTWLRLLPRISNSFVKPKEQNKSRAQERSNNQTRRDGSRMQDTTVDGVQRRLVRGACTPRRSGNVKWICFGAAGIELWLAVVFSARPVPGTSEAARGLMTAMD